MENLEELKKLWHTDGAFSAQGEFDLEALNSILRKKVKKINNDIMMYFWASFVYNILIYALTIHVIIRFWGDLSVVVVAPIAIFATIPFTVILLKRYKAMAASFAKSRQTQSIQAYISRQRDLLLSFFRFKRRYEWFLIPLNAAIGVILVFNIFVPGGVMENLTGAGITFLLTLVSCVIAVRNENQKRFTQPLTQLQAILDEFDMPLKK